MRPPMIRVHRCERPRGHARTRPCGQYRRARRRAHMRATHRQEDIVMAASNPLNAFSDHAVALVERAAGSIVAVNCGRAPASGIHWRSGVIVTAEENLEQDEAITV